MALGVIVAAGGAGKRFGGEKVLAPVRGKPLLLWTLDRLRLFDEVREIVLVLPAERIDAIRAEWGPSLMARGVTRIVPGGVVRPESVRNGLLALPPDADPVLVHDAARPLASPDAARQAVEAAMREGAAVVGVPARDTLKRVDAARMVAATLPREEIWHAETPQVVRRELLFAAYRKADEDGFTARATDEASLVEHLGARVAMVRGGPWNVKVTEREDLRLVEALLELVEGGWSC